MNTHDAIFLLWVYISGSVEVMECDTIKDAARLCHDQDGEWVTIGLEVVSLGNGSSFLAWSESNAFMDAYDEIEKRRINAMRRSSRRELGYIEIRTPGEFGKGPEEDWVEVERVFKQKNKKRRMTFWKAMLGEDRVRFIKVGS